MASSKLPEYHVLDFFQDDQHGSALTVRAHRQRWHIIVDGERLKSSAGKAGGSIVKEYERLYNRAKKEGADEEGGSAGADARTETSNGEHDSGVEMGSGEEDDNQRKSDEVAGSSDDRSACDTLQDWIMSPMKEIVSSAASKNGEDSPQTVQDWYHCTTDFYHLDIDNGKLMAKEEEPGEDLDERMDGLIPDMPLPKYIRNLGIEMVSAEDITIVAESTEPEPVHPAVVEVGGERRFLKVVDMNQFQPTKREIQLMKRIEKKGLHKSQIRMPLIRGLVHFQGQKGKGIMGFLMDAINDPTPLTHKLSSEVPQKQRDEWARESERMIKALNDNGIIWGDAKADNFMVDADDNLWIIDFGGSYTEGWVDPELKETMEGDQMGIKKIVNALHDPESNTFDPSAEEQLEPAASGTSGKKRKSDDDDEEDNDGNKRVKHE